MSDTMTGEAMTLAEVATLADAIRAEVAKVVWPTRREVLLTTIMVVIMAVSASRPVVRFAEHCLAVPAIRLGGGSPAAWWLSVLTLAPLLGSLPCCLRNR